VDDAQLIARSVSDGRWFEVVFDRHYGRIHRFCVARAGLDTADDLASETFVTAFRRRDAYDVSHADAAPWLYGIALNLLRAHRRRELARGRLVDRARLALRSLPEPEQPYDRNAALSAALRGLSEQDRDLIVLFAWAGLTYEQLGECLGLPVGTVRSRLSRLRERLRRQLEPALAEDTV
jgi:RNA polymerase sigma-70 factor (ECF subfamily)